MAIVTVSPKYQVVIPKEIRESMELKPGMKISMIKIGQAIHLSKVRPMSDFRGSVPNVSSKVIRDEDREL